MDNQSQIAVIILNYNSWQDTVTLVKNLASQQEVALEIIIVDNASPNDSLRSLQEQLDNQAHLHLLSAPGNGGYAKGNNIGLRFGEALHCEYGVILNNDVMLDDPLLLKKLSSVSSKYPNCGFIAPIMENQAGDEIKHIKKIPGYWKDLSESSFLSRWLFSKLLSKSIYYDRTNPVEEVAMIPGSFIFFKYALFKQIGYFDETTFLYGEERILAMKCREYHLTSMICTGLAYRHCHGKTISSFHNTKSKMTLVLTSFLYFDKRYRKSGFVRHLVLELGFRYAVVELSVIGKLQSWLPFLSPR